MYIQLNSYQVFDGVSYGNNVVVNKYIFSMEMYPVWSSMMIFRYFQNVP